MLNIVCLKHGDKYPAVYVNKLYSMTMRHLTVPHRFICFTDNSSGIYPSIEVRMLPKAPLSGWWWKLYFFKQDLFDSGDQVFFMDLDTVIIKNIDHLVTPEDRFVGLRDVGRVFGNPPKLGSAIMKFPAGCFSDLWETIISNPNKCSSFRGDQDMIWHYHSKEIAFFPDTEIRSYKWEIRNLNELYRSPSGWHFKTIRDPEVDPATSIIVFHGTPAIHEVKDPIIIDNWR